MTNVPRVNYDTVAATYDNRVSDDYLAGVREAFQTLVQKTQAQRILDIGCGTGRSLQLLDDGYLAPTAQRYGLDFSSGMLTQARQLNGDYRLVNASAPLPPFVDASFDLITCVLAFHHFPDKPQVVQAAYDLLRPGGALAIVNYDPRETVSYQFTYFEGVYETDLGRFPAIADQEIMLQEAGFTAISSPVVWEIKEPMTGAEILDSYFLRKDASSQLILISDEAYQNGLERIKQDIATAEKNGTEIVFPTHIQNRMCHGFKL